MSAEPELSREQGLVAMYRFLEIYAPGMGNPEELQILLSAMSLVPEGTADPAIGEMWNEAVEDVLAGRVDARMVLTK